MGKAVKLVQNKKCFQGYVEANQSMGQTSIKLGVGCVFGGRNDGREVSVSCMVEGLGCKIFETGADYSEESQYMPL